MLIYHFDKMEEQKPSVNVNFTAESAQLEQTLLDRHRHTDNSPNICWVAGKDFTVDVGKKQIAEYIESWELKPCWLYSLDFLYSTEEEHHTFYHYRARFSTPTPRTPIQGTASVYFVVDKSKVRPRNQPVEVHYMVESNRLVLTPGSSRFTERWLADVIETKTLLRRAVDL